MSTLSISRQTAYIKKGGPGAMRQMKIRLAIFLLAISAAGCKKNTPQGVGPDAFRLIYPGKDSMVDPCCTYFKWETSLQGAYQLTISDSADFTNPLIDTVIYSKDFQYPYILNPEFRYYWRVKQGDAEKTSSFRIKDILSRFLGNCTVQIHKYNWGAAQTGLDTVYVDTILIEKVASVLALKREDFAELLITEYPVGSVINWHRDAPPFDLIAGISLLADCTFRLRPHEKIKQGRGKIISFPVKRRSLYKMGGAARTDWQHSVAPVTQVRYSITLRTLKKEIVS